MVYAFLFYIVLPKLEHSGAVGKAFDSLSVRWESESH